MQADQLRQNMIIRGPLFSEAVQVMMVAPMGASVQIFGKGLTSGRAYTSILSPEQLATLEASPDRVPFDGNATKYRLGIEALRLGLAYEYDPYFALSIARVDPLPHQLEAVYDYFLAQPRIRFLLADDPGAGKTIMAGLDGRIKQLDDHVMTLNTRLEQRLIELQQERHCTVDDTRHYGQAWVLPHPERNTPAFISMVRDERIEQRAIEEAIRYERNRGWHVESVESENRGFDLISRSPDLLGQKVRFIEVKGRASVGEVALTDNEYKTADRLKGDYWLYVVYNCATLPELHPVNDPTRMDWVPRVRIEHYLVNPESILQFAQDDDV